MNLKRILTSSLIGLSTLLPLQARDPQTFNVPQDGDFQTLLNNAEDGDTYILTDFYGDVNVNKSVTITSSSRTSGIAGSLTTSGGANVRLENMLVNGLNVEPELIRMTESSSLTLDEVITTNSAGSILTKDSTGNLHITNSKLNYGDIRITNGTGNTLIDNSSLMGEGYITIDCEDNSSNIGSFYLLNNLIYGHGSRSIIKLLKKSNLDGEIANNCFYNNGEAVELESTDKLNKLGFRKNNFYSGCPFIPSPLLDTMDFSALVKSDDNLLDVQGTEYEGNYYLNPQLNQDGTLTTGSPLYGIALYQDGITTWFPDADKTWIGKRGDVAPWETPEPTTTGLLGLGAGYLLSRRNRGEK